MSMTTSTDPGIAARTTVRAMGAPTPKRGNGLLAKKAQDVAAAGGGHDTRLVHVTPKEEAALKRGGGTGAVNLKTGLRKYDNEGGGGTGTGSGTNDADAGGKGLSGDGEAGPSTATEETAPNLIERSLNKVQAAIESDPWGAALTVAGMVPGPIGMAASAISAGRAIAGMIDNDRSKQGSPAGDDRGGLMSGGIDTAGKGVGGADTEPQDVTAGSTVAPATTAKRDNGLLVRSDTTVYGSPAATAAADTPATKPQGSYKYDPTQGRVAWVADK